MPTVPSPQTVLDRVRRDVERNALRARNGISSSPGRPSRRRAEPKDVVWQRGRTRAVALPQRPRDVRRVRYGPPLVIVFSLISRSYILDLTPGNSFVEQLLSVRASTCTCSTGASPTSGTPATGSRTTSTTISPPAIDRARELSGADEVNLLGYCFGGAWPCSTPRTTPTRRCAASRCWPPRSTSGTWARWPTLFRVGGLEVDTVLDPDGQRARRAIVVQGFTHPHAHGRGDPLRDAVGAPLERRVRRRLSGDDRLVRRPRALPGRRRRGRRCGCWCATTGCSPTGSSLGGDPVHLRDITVPFLTVGPTATTSSRRTSPLP